MSRVRGLAALFAVSLTLAGTSFAASPAYSSSRTKIGELLANPQSRAILDRRLPGISTNSRTRLAKGMTLRQIQPHAPKQVTDEVLAKIDDDLAKLSPAP